MLGCCLLSKAIFIVRPFASFLVFVLLLTKSNEPSEVPMKRLDRSDTVSCKIWQDTHTTCVIFVSHLYLEDWESLPRLSEHLELSGCSGTFPSFVHLGPVGHEKPFVNSVNVGKTASRIISISTNLAHKHLGWTKKTRVSGLMAHHQALLRIRILVTNITSVCVYIYIYMHIHIDLHTTFFSSLFCPLFTSQVSSLPWSLHVSSLFTSPLCSILYSLHFSSLFTSLFSVLL